MGKAKGKVSMIQWLNYKITEKASCVVHNPRCSVIRQQASEAKQKWEKNVTLSPTCSFIRPSSAPLPGQPLLCCPETGAPDLERNTKTSFSSETVEVSSPPMAKCTRWTLWDTIKIGKHGERHRQVKHNEKKKKWCHILSHRPNLSHPTPLLPAPYLSASDCTLSGRGTLQCPTEHTDHVRSVSPSPFSCNCAALVLCFHCYQPAFLQKSFFYLSSSRIYVSPILQYSMWG